MFDLDSHEIEIQCPACSFFGRVRLCDVRLRGLHICRGCKGNIRLDDHKDELRKARKQLAGLLKGISPKVLAMNKKINIKI